MSGFFFMPPIKAFDAIDTPIALPTQGSVSIAAKPSIARIRGRVNKVSI
jgi:hypothetical protein